MNKTGFYNTNATYEQAVNALGTVISEWDIHDTETHKIKVVSTLLHTPETVFTHETWNEQIANMDKDNSERLGYILWDMKRVIFNYLYDAMGEFVKKGRPEEDNLQTDIYTELANHYADMPEELKNVLRFGYALTDSLNIMVTTGGILRDGFNDDGVSMLGMAINWTLNHREFRTGECIDINNIYMYEEGALKYIEENDLDKAETVPLTRDCFMTNISEMLGRKFYVTSDYFALVLEEYQDSAELPYTFCKEWFERNKDEEIFADDFEIDGEKYALCVTDDDLLTLRDDVKVMDIIDSLAKDVQRYKYSMFMLMNAYKKLEGTCSNTVEEFKNLLETVQSM